MYKIIIYDFEVFMYDTLFGAKILTENTVEVFQTWDLEEIKKFYEENKNNIFIGHNNNNYDDLILDAVVTDSPIYHRSKSIIVDKKRFYPKIKLISYDLLNSVLKPFGLKLTELLIGKNVHTSPVDFNLDRPLTEEEKVLTEKYNMSDLDQTHYNFLRFKDKFDLRLEIILEFNLPLEALQDTGTQIASRVLKAKKNPALEYAKLSPVYYDNLIIENQEMLNFYLNEDFRTEKNKQIVVGESVFEVGSGGIHSAIKKYYCKKVLYLDVGGYYNTIMIKYDLLPRTINEEGKQLYIYMFDEQLKLKKINPVKRKVYKEILLAVFGAMNNQYCDFYDPYKFILVTLTGELFIVDLCEKLNPYVKLVQANTDGIMLEINEDTDENKIKEIIDEWQNRTGFNLEFEYLYNLFQRDVNCYFCQDSDMKIINKGEALKNYYIDDNAFSKMAFFNCKEPPVVAQGIINCLMYDKSPEDFVEENKKNLRLFQYSCKKNTFDCLVYDELNVRTGEKTQIVVDSPVRAFAYKSNVFAGMLYKHKRSKGKTSISKVSNLPDNVFVYNDEILSESAYETIKDEIDYQYYVNRIYERIGEFI